MSRRREKRNWIGEKGSLGDGQRRRSPRLVGSTFKPACPPKINGDCSNASKQSNKNLGIANVGGDAVTNAKVAASKHRKVLLYNSDDNEEVNYKLVPSLSSCPKPYTKALSGHPLNSSKKDDGAPNHHDHSNNDESWLPEKSILELVLDTLQRRDTYDIFAEPVDPSEVEEYYEIVKEPMDFGTMRAKLHEGMYKSLLQFERDIFLIFGNAMHFNSSATVYFRQARALGELAKKVFHLLKTDPENFKSEFTATRRRSSRKFNGELSGLAIESGQKLARDPESNSACTDLGRKGCQRQKRNLSTGIDWRSSYKPLTSQLDESNSTLSSLYRGTNTLICGNPEMGYKESLMLFVKDLGPTAHRIAKTKLQGLEMQASSSNLGMNCWGSATHHKWETTHAAYSPLQRESELSSSRCSNLVATTPSHHLFNMKVADETRSHADTMLPILVELKHTQAGNFDLNQPTKQSRTTLPSRLLGISKLNHRLSPAGHSNNSNMMLPPSSFISMNLNPINLPCSKSKLRESLINVDNSRKQLAALQKPRYIVVNS